MITEQFAIEQVRRLGGLNFFPRDNPAAFEELVKAAMTAETEEACRKGFDTILFDSDDCPKPADIIRVMGIENEKINEHRPLKKKHSLCGGTGYVHGVYLVTKHIEETRDGEVHAWTDKRLLTTDEQIKQVKRTLKPKQQVIEASQMCDCHPGRTS
jgi:hypothetical protein